MPVKGSRQTHCKRGHVYEEGWACCKVCRRATNAKAQAKRRGDPEKRAKDNAQNKASQAKKMEDPEFRAKVNARDNASKGKRMEDPEYRAKFNAKTNEYHKSRKKTDLHYKLTMNLRTRLHNAISRGSKTGSAVRDLGCSIEEFKSFIENQFTEGMSWENHGEWHLDHVRPLASFDLEDREQLLIACNWQNFQPLWATDNIRKGAKY